ncbi:MAG: hypothetical protein HQL50_08760 [Magnetococcales bacterium]|nr:hypothetical protein [Magnetococcales bacterium]
MKRTLPLLLLTCTLMHPTTLSACCGGGGGGASISGASALAAVNTRTTRVDFVPSRRASPQMVRPARAASKIINVFFPGRNIPASRMDRTMIGLSMEMACEALDRDQYCDAAMGGYDDFGLPNPALAASLESILTELKARQESDPGFASVVQSIQKNYGHRVDTHMARLDDR